MNLINIFLTVAENIIVKNLNDKNSLLNNTVPLGYLHNAFKHLFPVIKIKYTTTNEIEETIKSLKEKNSHGYDGMSTKNSKTEFVIYYISFNLYY
jgi:hypothetical protein